MVDETAEKGFGQGAAAYERGRPGYPPELVDLLARELELAPGRTVVDVGAGTGKLTRLLPATGAEVWAVEPVAGMRQQLESLLPGVRSIDAPAEAIPVDDASVDAVVVAQAFHWFDHQRALAEIGRILRPGGGMALVWNVRDGSVPWVAQLSEMIHWHRHDISAYEDRIDWAAVVAESRVFTPLQKSVLHHEQEHDHATLLDRVASVSYIAAMEERDRAAILEQVGELIAPFPEVFPLPYRTDVYWCRKAGD